MKKMALALFLLSLTVSQAQAHPGNTASDGCHYCRTNCDRWGVAWNQRHCHGGTAPVATVAPTRVYTPSPTRVATPTPTRIYTPTPTRPITPTPSAKATSTPMVTPTVEFTLTPTQISSPTPTILSIKTSQKSGFWAWLISLFNGQ